MNAAPIREAAVAADPGADDGAVAIVSPDGREVWAWYAWSELESAPGRVRLRTWKGIEIPGLRLHEALRWILDDVVAVLEARRIPTVRLAVEGLFIPKFTKKNGKITPGNTLVLIDAGGQAVGILAPLDPDREPHRPTATVWRKRQLGPEAVGLDAAVVEALAISLALSSFRWPHLVPAGWLTGPEKGAVCEAAWMARDALFHSHLPALARVA